MPSGKFTGLGRPRNVASKVDRGKIGKDVAPAKPTSAHARRGTMRLGVTESMVCQSFAGYRATGRQGHVKPRAIQGLGSVVSRQHLPSDFLVAAERSWARTAEDQRARDRLVVVRILPY